ncbi:MAG: cation-transporting P-type ATPase [Pyrinomonadaceae bacterium]|nr:cation-transporting P-type ATPase [Pyrinomonadaceae bacterium]
MPQALTQTSESEVGDRSADGSVRPYAESWENVSARLGVDTAFGLESTTAKARLAQYGPNALEQPGGRSAFGILASQFKSIVVWLLVAAAAVALFTDGPLEAAAIGTVLILNALIGFAIEWQAGRALEALKRSTVMTARVRRDGRESVVDASEIVPGDLVVLSAGDRVPADARLVEAANLRTDESTLTGESMPVEKGTIPSRPETPLAEQSSMIFLGTNVTAGKAVAIVTATGLSTEIGRIGKMLAAAEDRETPLERRLGELGRRLVYIVLGIAAVVLAAGYLRGDDPFLMAKVAISLAVAAVPEGLPAVTTLILALGVLRMARQSAIVRHLAAVETLGSTTVICTDKTGTLTENRMAVVEVLTAERLAQPLDASPAASSEAVDRLWRVAVLCNEAAASGDAEAIGDPTETALLVAAGRHGRDADVVRSQAIVDYEIPFDSGSKRMITVIRDQNGERTALLKGAPTVVIDACSHLASHDVVSLDATRRRELLKANDKVAARALRVLAFADKRVGRTRQEGEVDDGFTLLGFVGMTDPPRPAAHDAIRKAKDAGIRIVMLTGDQVLTASAIARELRISEDHDVVALHADDLADADSGKLATLAREAHVFARVTPEDKFRIVDSLQKADEVVAVTGDGVNDAPALKQADIGIAMGQRGTDVAKEASDIILTDDNFATIVTAIESGRAIFSNIIKFVHLMFSHNLGEIMMIFFAILLGLPLPLFPLQILWINLVTDIFPALALAVEPPGPETMKRKPRSPKESLLSQRFMVLIGWQGVMLAAIALAAYYWALQSYGEGEHARTVALLALVAVQAGHLFNCRSRRRSAFSGVFRNPFVFAAVAVVTVLQLFAVYFEPLRSVLGLTVPNGADWAIIAGCLFLPIAIVELTKLLTPMPQDETLPVAVAS